MTEMLAERYQDRMHGVLSCFDRIVVTGTLPISLGMGGRLTSEYAFGRAFLKTVLHRYPNIKRLVNNCIDIAKNLPPTSEVRCHIDNDRT